MKIYEVYTPEIQSIVRYKVLPPEDVDTFVEERRGLPRDEYIRQVLEFFIFNLKSEITNLLKHMSRPRGRNALESLFNGCVMLNPGLDIDSWLKISNGTNTIDGSGRQAELAYPKRQARIKRAASSRGTKITKVKFLQMESHLKNIIIGQDEAVEHLCRALKRTVAGLGDDTRPLGVFLLAGASGVGKTYVAKELHKYLYGDSEMVRIDCGEYQHKHENQKLVGSPPGFVAHDEGGVLTNALIRNPHTVVLLDEVEKAHSDIWDTFLRVFDEGLLTDGSGKVADFRDSIIIMTTNLGNKDVVDGLLAKGIGFGRKGIYTALSEAQSPVRAQVERMTHDAIRKQFKPELLNRIDNTVVFNHLTNADFRLIADLEMGVVERKLEKRGFSLSYDDTVIDGFLKEGTNAVQGARGLSQVRRDRIESSLADVILAGRFPRGTNFQLTWGNEEFSVLSYRPKKDVAAV